MKRAEMFWLAFEKFAIAFSFVVNMALVMVPMAVLYFISIGLSYIAYAGRNKRAE